MVPKGKESSLSFYSDKVTIKKRAKTNTIYYMKMILHKIFYLPIYLELIQKNTIKTNIPIIIVKKGVSLLNNNIK